MILWWTQLGLGKRDLEARASLVSRVLEAEASQEVVKRSPSWERKKARQAVAGKDLQV